MTTTLPPVIGAGRRCRRGWLSVWTKSSGRVVDLRRFCRFRCGRRLRRALSGVGSGGAGSGGRRDRSTDSGAGLDASLDSPGTVTGGPDGAASELDSRRRAARRRRLGRSTARRTRSPGRRQGRLRPLATRWTAAIGLRALMGSTVPSAHPCPGTFPGVGRRLPGLSVPPTTVAEEVATGERRDAGARGLRPRSLNAAGSREPS